MTERAMSRFLSICEAQGKAIWKASICGPLIIVNRRTRSQIVPILRERLERTRKEELDTALDELVSIAQDRWERG